MEYLPHNGNAFDLSVSELLNLMLPVHFDFFVCCVCMCSSACALLCFFCAFMKILCGPLQLDSIISTVKL